MSQGRAAGPSEVFFEASLRGADVVVTGEEAVVIGHRVLSADAPAAGNWVEWRWDGEAFTVTNDRYGGFPVYYAITDTSISVSPSIDVLLGRGVPRELDMEALAAFLAVGYYFGSDTPFRSIRALPPATTLTWRQGVVTITSRPSRAQRVEMSRDEAIDGVVGLVRSAVGRSIPDTDGYAMPISGGRDSRHLMLELIRAGHPPSLGVTAHHHALDWGGDPPFAARLCAELGVAHKIVSPGALVLDEWRKNQMTSYCADEHAWYLPVADELSASTSHTYDGLNGSTSLRRNYYPARAQKLSRAGKWDELAAWMGKKDEQKRPRFSALISRDVSDALDGEQAAARIRRELQGHLDTPEPFLSMRFWNRTIRELSLPSSALLGSVPAVYTPYMDPGFVQFAWSIPNEHIDAIFHTDVIARAFPAESWIPYLSSTEPELGRRFMREVNRDLMSLLRHHSDGSLVDRASLMRRAAHGAVTGSAWFAWGRRASLTTYLVQLESLVAGGPPRDLTAR